MNELVLSVPQAKPRDALTEPPWLVNLVTRSHRNVRALNRVEFSIEHVTELIWAVTDQRPTPRPSLRERGIGSQSVLRTTEDHRLVQVVYISESYVP